MSSHSRDMIHISLVSEYNDQTETKNNNSPYMRKNLQFKKKKKKKKQIQVCHQTVIFYLFYDHILNYLKLMCF